MFRNRHRKSGFARAHLRSIAVLAWCMVYPVPHVETTFSNVGMYPFFFFSLSHYLFFSNPLTPVSCRIRPSSMKSSRP
ncbi:hypothetical protein F4809DRAFT_597880 [Biscogniauxia mediterranea]|nr:hypothetical protein F4809DRAFT_597880 [Biscogniauxia mediterranea]